MNVNVEVWESANAFRDAYQNKHSRGLVRYFLMDHNDPAQRRVLGEQCRSAFEAGQLVMTWPLRK